MNLEDLIGKKVRVRGTALAPGSTTKIADIILESIDILEDPIPDEPLGATRVELIGSLGTSTAYVRVSENQMWTRKAGTGVYRTWSELVRFARNNNLTVRVVNEVTEDIA